MLFFFFFYKGLTLPKNVYACNSSQLVQRQFCESGRSRYFTLILHDFHISSLGKQKTDLTAC